MVREGIRRELHNRRRQAFLNQGACPRGFSMTKQVSGSGIADKFAPSLGEGTLFVTQQPTGSNRRLLLLWDSGPCRSGRRDKRVEETRLTFVGGGN